VKVTSAIILRGNLLRPAQPATILIQSQLASGNADQWQFRQANGLKAEPGCTKWSGRFSQFQQQKIPGQIGLLA
jgi:hypothetical protein